MPLSVESAFLAYPGTSMHLSAYHIHAHGVVQSLPLSSPRALSSPSRRPHAQEQSLPPPPLQALAAPALLSESVALRAHLSLLTCLCSSSPTTSTFFHVPRTLSFFLPQDFCFCYSQFLECHPPGWLHDWLFPVLHQASLVPVTKVADMAPLISFTVLITNHESPDCLCNKMFQCDSLRLHKTRKSKNYHWRRVQSRAGCPVHDLQT